MKIRYTFKKVVGILIVLCLIVVAFATLVAFPFFRIKESIKAYEESKKINWNELYERRKPYETVITQFYSLYEIKVTLVYHGATLEARSERGYEGSKKADVYNLSRNSIFDMSWNVKELSANTVENKLFEQVVELAKKTDIGMINMDHECIARGGSLMECQLRDGREIDKDIVTYFTTSKDPNETETEPDGSEYSYEYTVGKDEPTSDVPRDLSSYLSDDPTSLISKMEVLELAKKLQDELDTKEPTPARREEMYIEYFNFLSKYPENEAKDRDDVLKGAREKLGLDENGKYIVPSPTPTPAGN